MTAVLIAVLVGALRGSSGGGGAHGSGPWGGSADSDRLPWGGADEPFHPRDRDLRDLAAARAGADYWRRRALELEGRLDDPYGGDFGPPPGAA